MLARPLLLATVLLASLLGTACRKDCDPAPRDQPKDPEAEVKMERTTTYLTAGRFNNGQSYSQKTLQSTATLSTDNLQLAFNAPEGKDAINFTIPGVALGATLVGTYELRSSALPQAPVATVYTYFRSRSTNGFSSVMYRNVGGRLTITAYDAQRQLLTGSYQARLENILDPADGNSPLGDVLRCNVEITGSFTNLKVQ